MYLLEPMFQRKVFIFMSCILMNNKDWFDLMVLDAFLLLLLSWQRRWMPVGDCGTLENPKTWPSPPTSTWQPTPPRAAGRGEARPPDCPSSARPTPVCKVQFIVHQRRTQYRSVGLLLIIFTYCYLFSLEHTHCTLVHVSLMMMWGLMFSDVGLTY